MEIDLSYLINRSNVLLNLIRQWCFTFHYYLVLGSVSLLRLFRMFVDIVIMSFVDMELELPKQLYAESSEPRVKKINNSCRMELIRDLKKAMCAEYDDVKRDPVFTHIMAIAENDLKFSGKLVDSFICRQLITSKLHEKWFVFARTPLRFLLQEYHAVTGLKITGKLTVT